MKYAEALNRIAIYCGVNNGSMLEDDLKTLQELVDKAIPKKTSWSANNKGITFDCCPNCSKRIKPTYKFCPFCSQALEVE